jgi:hypothetical protein
MVLLCNESVNSPGGQSIDEMPGRPGRGPAARRVGAAKMSEHRRLALLPCGGAVTWDALMTEPRYMRALAAACPLTGCQCGLTRHPLGRRVACPDGS